MRYRVMKRAFAGTAVVWALLFAFASVPAVWAREYGILAGVVVDARTGQSLSRANLLLEENGLGTIADAEGAFRIARLRPGAYTLIVSFVGYRTAFVEVSVTAGAATRVAIRLRPEPVELRRVLVEADPAASSAASSRPAREFDLRVRPLRSSQDLLQVVPGLVAGQAGGKAAQIFLRGFDAGFGTDVAVSVDGMPVNLVSHGHGQGYADLNFVIPETVERVEVFKGPYFAEFGNLATAGQIAIRTRSRLDQSSVRVERGAFDAVRYAALYQLPGDEAENSAYFAGDFWGTDGPFDHPEELRRLRIFAKGRQRLSAETTLSLEAGGFGSSWNSSGLVPQREIERGNITRWGAVNDAQGGSTARQNLVVEYRAEDAENGGEFAVWGYLSGYSLTLFSDYTFLLQDGVFGDMVEQVDRRLVAGLDSRYRRSYALGRMRGVASLGGGLRADDIERSMWQVVERRRYWPLVDDAVRERNLFLWGQQELVPGPGWRLALGLRGDYFTFRVEDRLEKSQDGIPTLADVLQELRSRGKPVHVPLIQAHASGVAEAFVLSPKVGLVCSPAGNLDLFANGGMGFHSNDARSAVIGRFIEEQWKFLEEKGATDEEIVGVLEALNFDPEQRRARILPRATGGEVGVRLRLLGGEEEWLDAVSPSAPGMGHYPGDRRLHAPVAPLKGRLNLAAAVWWIDVDDERIYAADAGVTQMRGRTRRRGTDLEIRAQVLSWLWVDADLNWARGRLRDAPGGEDAVPLAPRFTSVGGFTARRGDRWEGRLRYVRVDDRPAAADGRITAPGYAVFDLATAYHADRWRADLVVENVFDAKWNQVQFAYESMTKADWEDLLRGGEMPGPDRHFAPGNPRGARIGVNFFF